jgi:hypothetical protein
MGFADTVFRSFTAVLGGTTVIAGVWLAGTMISGFTRDRKVSEFDSFCPCDHWLDQILKITFSDTRL